MMKKARCCDVCGKEISWHSDRYKFTQIRFLYGSGETHNLRDMCSDCYRKFVKFLRRNDNNAQ